VYIRICKIGKMFSVLNVFLVWFFKCGKKYILIVNVTSLKKQYLQRNVFSFIVGAVKKLSFDRIKDSIIYFTLFSFLILFQKIYNVYK